MTATKKRRTKTHARATTAPDPVTPDADGRIDLPDGRWCYPMHFDDGTTLTDPTDPRMWVWERGEDGRDVCWRGQAETADLLDITPRWLQQLERKGMPARGFRATCEYPWPHALAWFAMFKQRTGRGQKVHALTITDAFADYEYQNAVEEAKIERRMKTDPLYRDWMLAEEAEDFPRAEELLHQLRARGRQGEGDDDR